MQQTSLLMREVSSVSAPLTGAKARVSASIERLAHWLEEHEYRGYDTFDGLNARYLRPLTLNSALLRTVLLQAVRRFPVNLRPLLGIRPDRSSKGMGFLARAFIRLNKANGDPAWNSKAEMALRWLMDNRLPGYHGACWGNHFDYQSRTFFLPKGVPTIVWTSLIGHAFLDGYVHFGRDEYLNIAISACEHILRDIAATPDGDTICLAYVPGRDAKVHNANTLGASLLARTGAATGNERYLQVARKALDYTAKYMRSDGSWFYGERENLHWVDNFHTAYVLDCFLHYLRSTDDQRFTAVMMRGYEYWKSTFFLADGTPRYYSNKTLPLDIQCCSQAIDTLTFFQDQDPAALSLAVKVADWTISQMQDPSGFFYYRRYSRHVVNRTPTLHWGQATMLCALSGLYRAL